MRKKVQHQGHIKDRDFCSVTDAVEYTTLSDHVIYGMIRSKKIDAKVVGRRYLIVVPSLLRALNGDASASELLPPAGEPASVAA